MAPFIEFLTTSGKIWVANPIEFAGAMILGILVGYLLSRLRYQGTVQALNVRLDHKDDVIKLKDDVIASASAAAPRSDAAPGLESPKQPTPADTAPPPQFAEDPRFRSINAKILSEVEASIHKAVKTNVYSHVYNPESGRAKTLTFKAGGYIGEGRNDNESRWRVAGGRLEILNSQMQVYSRFFLLPDGRSFHHTNDPDTLSIKGQYLTPIDHATSSDHPRLSKPLP
jgi:hypothetical protein